MNLLWNYIKKLEINTKSRIRLFLLLNTIAFSLFGFIIGLPVMIAFKVSLWTLFCFTGYPAVFLGLFGGIIFLGEKTDKSS